MTQFPVTRDDTTLMLERMSGKFHGQMAATTPSGTCVATTFVVSSSYWTSSSRAVFANRLLDRPSLRKRERHTVIQTLRNRSLDVDIRKDSRLARLLAQDL